MKILLAVDGSDYTRKMLHYVSSNRALFDPSHEYVLFIAQPALPPHARSMLDAGTVNSYYEDETKKVLEPAQAELKAAGLDARTEWKVGPVGETIGAFAEDGKFDLVIMGSHGHGALTRLVMGSVTTEVLARCGVPVLLIR